MHALAQRHTYISMLLYRVHHRLHLHVAIHCIQSIQQQQQYIYLICALSDMKTKLFQTVHVCVYDRIAAIASSVNRFSALRTIVMLYMYVSFAEY